MFKTKFGLSASIFIAFLVITSSIKNETRIIEKKLSSLNIKVLLKKKDINETQLDFYYLTSPAEIETRLNKIGFENYEPIAFSRIFFNLNDFIKQNKKISNLKNSNEEKTQKK